MAQLVVLAQDALEGGANLLQRPIEHSRDRPKTRSAQLDVARERTGVLRGFDLRRAILLLVPRDHPRRQGASPLWPIPNIYEGSSCLARSAARTRGTRSPVTMYTTRSAMFTA